MVAIERARADRAHAAARGAADALSVRASESGASNGNARLRGTETAIGGIGGADGLSAADCGPVPVINVTNVTNVTTVARRICGRASGDKTPASCADGRAGDAPRHHVCSCAGRTTSG